MSDPLSNPNISTTNVGGNIKSNSAGTPYTTPLQTSTQPNSFSATNSPMTNNSNNNMINNNSSNNLAGMNSGNTPGGGYPLQPSTTSSNISSSASINNLSSLTGQQQQQATTVTSRNISSSCFEFFYIEMIDYIMKSSTDKTQAHKKLDKLGYKVGHRLVERLSLDTALFPDLLDAVKFICKVFWLTIFKKTIDGLKTNHKGVFVLTDSKFQWLQHLSFDSSASNKDCSEYVQFTAGLIKGAMSNFGFKCIVTFDIQQVSTCVFTIKIES